VSHHGKDAEWMNPSDEKILGLLDSADIVLSTAVLTYNLDYSRGEISRRLGKLSEAGLVIKHKDGYYEISENGRAYLEGEFDARKLEEPE